MLRKGYTGKSEKLMQYRNVTPAIFSIFFYSSTILWSVRGLTKRAINSHKATKRFRKIFSKGIFDDKGIDLGFSLTTKNREN